MTSEQPDRDRAFRRAGLQLLSVLVVIRAVAGLGLSILLVERIRDPAEG